MQCTKPALGVAWQHKTDVRLQLADPRGDNPASSASLSAAAVPPPQLPRTLSVLKSSLAARGVIEGEVAAATLSPAGLFV